MSDFSTDLILGCASLPSPLKEIAGRYLTRQQQCEHFRCECRNGHCISGTWEWGIREIIYIVCHQTTPRPASIRSWFERMFNTCDLMLPYSLQFHALATEEQIKAIHQEMLAIFDEELQKHHLPLAHEKGKVYDHASIPSI